MISQRETATHRLTGRPCGCPNFGDHEPSCKVGQHVVDSVCYRCSSAGIEVLKAKAARGLLCKCAAVVGFDIHAPREAV
jgi:hypothetical protein